MDSQVSSDRGSRAQVGTAHAVPRFGEVAASALRYWEPRRILYNLALTCVVLAHFIMSWPVSRAFMTWNVFFLLIILAVLANVCYCALGAASGRHGLWCRHCSFLFHGHAVSRGPGLRRSKARCLATG